MNVETESEFLSSLLLYNKRFGIVSNCRSIPAGIDTSLYKHISLSRPSADHCRFVKGITSVTARG
jgi:hypothetical protein